MEFKQETKELLDQMIGLLEEAEEGLDHIKNLTQFGQLVDRIMGSAKSLSMALDEGLLNAIGSCAEICKIVGYKGSKVKKEGFYIVVVGLLLDATETLIDMNESLGQGSKTAADFLHETFIQRLKIVDQQFDENIRGTLEFEKQPENKQQSVDDILRQLGV